MDAVDRTSAVIFYVVGYIIIAGASSFEMVAVGITIYAVCVSLHYCFISNYASDGSSEAIRTIEIP